MEKTTNYKLPRWEKDDFVKMDDFNAAFQTIDETLKAGADAVADEAAARETAVTALAQDVGSGGRVCRITTGSYTGNGKTGETNKRTISVDFTPVLVAVVSEGDITGNYGYTPMLLLRGCTTASRNTFTCGGSAPTVSWGTKSVSWYAGHDMTALNYKDWTYQYVVIGYSAE